MEGGLQRSRLVGKESVISDKNYCQGGVRVQVHIFLWRAAGSLTCKRTISSADQLGIPARGSYSLIGTCPGALQRSRICNEAGSFLVLFFSSSVSSFLRSWALYLFRKARGMTFGRGVKVLLHGHGSSKARIPLLLFTILPYWLVRIARTQVDTSQVIQERSAPCLNR